MFPIKVWFVDIMLKTSKDVKLIYHDEKQFLCAAYCQEISVVPLAPSHDLDFMIVTYPATASIAAAHNMKLQH